MNPEMTKNRSTPAVQGRACEGVKVAQQRPARVGGGKRVERGAHLREAGERVVPVAVAQLVHVARIAAIWLPRLSGSNGLRMTAFAPSSFSRSTS